MHGGWSPVEKDRMRPEISFSNGNPRDFVGPVERVENHTNRRPGRHRGCGTTCGEPERACGQVAYLSTRIHRSACSRDVHRRVHTLSTRRPQRCPQANRRTSRNTVQDVVSACASWADVVDEAERRRSVARVGTPPGGGTHGPDRAVEILVDKGTCVVDNVRAVWVGVERRAGRVPSVRTALRERPRPIAPGRRRRRASPGSSSPRRARSSDRGPRRTPRSREASAR